MLLNYNIWLLLISTVAASASIFMAFSFVDRIHRSAIASKNTALLVFSLTIGTGVWANHFLVLLSSNTDATFHNPWLMASAWFFAVVIGSSLLFVATLRSPKFYYFVICGLVAGMSDLGLFYSSNNALYAMGVEFNPLMTCVSIFISICVITLIGMLFYWNKNYSGSRRTLVRLSLATAIALSVLSIHFVFDSAISQSLSVTTNSHSQVNQQMTGIAIALGMICLFMMLFIFTLFFEKNGKQLFKFSFLNPRRNAGNNPLSTLDGLTKLPNRKAFDAYLETAAKRSTRTKKTFAIAYIDLDHFKPINDHHGHHVGDAVLISAAERLSAAVRGCDYVARIGGDEFVAILEEIDSDDDIRPIAKRIVDSIKEPFFINNFNIKISCSVGIATYPRGGSLDKLLMCADAAMYKAKDEGKNQFKFYDAEIESATDLMLNLQRDLSLAIENKEFSLTYQPKINCKTLTALGVEALIRWNHPTQGVILPNDFLPAAERFGLINEINDWVVDECCSMITAARKHDINLNVSVNLSSHQFRNPDLVKNILKTIKFYDLGTNNLSFEIKETIAVNNQKQFKLLLDKFQEAGIKVVLDDFGSQPISLSYLLDINIDEIKIDKSFISTISQDKGSRVLVDAVIQLAHALGFQVVAEGVENESQRDAVIELGCDYMQGYLFSEPIEKEKLFALYKQLQVKQHQIDFDNHSPQAELSESSK